MAMNVELLDITDNSLERIGRYAGICYSSSQEESACIKRAIQCKDKGHLATLRFAYATFHVSGISRICSHQFVRSKHLDFLQRSQRYCKEDETGFIYPNDDPTYDEIYETCIKAYRHLLSKGVKKEDARFVLPEGTETELIVTGNFQAWLDFIALRGDVHAQWEIRHVAKVINNILAEKAPGIFNWAPL
jgi:thymidylate synthase (FAD)